MKEAPENVYDFYKSGRLRKNTIALPASQCGIYQKHRLVEHFLCVSTERLHVLGHGRRIEDRNRCWFADDKCLDGISVGSVSHGLGTSANDNVRSLRSIPELGGPGSGSSSEKSTCITVAQISAEQEKDDDRTVAVDTVASNLGAHWDRGISSLSLVRSPLTSVLGNWREDRARSPLVTIRPLR